MTSQAGGCVQRHNSIVSVGGDAEAGGKLEGG